MPWQQLVADVGGELLPGTRIPAYREVVVTVPRQNGKTTLILSWEVQRGVGWGEPQRIAYTAQTGKDAREKLLDDQGPLLDPLLLPKLPIKAAVKRVLRGVGNEAVVFKNGSRIFILNSGEEAGHGKVLDLGVIDESFADTDDRREQSMLPAMLTRAEAQILNISTAGTEKSVFLKRKVDAGRTAVANDEREGIAYFEWSAEEGADPDDPATWYSCMPALGLTITEAAVRHMRSTMTGLGEFERAGLNLWTVSEERVIPLAVWNAVCAGDVAPSGKLAIAVDVNPERTASAIATADSEGRVELVAFEPGVGRVVDRVVSLAKKLDCPVALDSKGPAGSLAADIEAKGVTVHGYTTQEMTYACASIYDAIADGKVAIRSHPDLDLAAAAARKRQLGDAWVWGRKDADKDVCPLVAVTIAFDKAASLGRSSDDLWVAW
ncbi:MAG: terminase [Acidimicrobiaceae bacterium]|nr:terminase [Acidimicrobiaceae bacterium]